MPESQSRFIWCTLPSQPLKSPTTLTRWAFGAQTAKEVPGQKRAGWGHSTWEDGIALRRAAGVKRVLMTHYDRTYNDAFLRGQEQLACQADSACQVAREGMVLTL